MKFSPRNVRKRRRQKFLPTAAITFGMMLAAACQMHRLSLVQAFALASCRCRQYYNTRSPLSFGVATTRSSRTHTSPLTPSRAPTRLPSTSPKQRTPYTIDDSVCAPTEPNVLVKAVQKACRSLDVYLDKKPMAAHTRQSFDRLLEKIRLDLGAGKDSVVQELIPKVYPGGIILDSGCGTGRSTKLLSEMFPKHLVIGIDRSIARLTKTKANQTHMKENTSIHSIQDAHTHSIASNAFLVRAELVDFWRCCLAHDAPFWTTHITHHYLLYPNPYPTPQRLSQRWYAHPSFPLLLKLNADRMVVRSNWETYLQEMAHAVMIAHESYCNDDGGGGEHNHNYAAPYLESAKVGPVMERLDKSVALTNFEAKYDAVGEPTFELILEKR